MQERWGKLRNMAPVRSFVRRLMKIDFLLLTVHAKGTANKTVANSIK
jgi:hypothetical protein